MRVLLQSRTTLFSVPGGDTIQVMKTMEYLQRAGCEVAVSTELEPDMRGYDLAHIFNVTRPQESYFQARNARQQGKKVVLSTIFVSYDEFDRKARGGVLGKLSRWMTPSQVEYLKIMGRAVYNAEYNRGTPRLMCSGYRRLVTETLNMAEVLLPNSVSELRRLATAFPEAAGRRSIVVPNGVDPALFGDPDIEIPPVLEMYRDSVLIVARIEGRKGQLPVVRAMRGLPWKLVLIGGGAPNHPAYYRQLLREAGPNVHLLGSVEHRHLPPFYRAARVHALVSWMETTGLSSLEAAAMGKNIVITGRGDTREYFGELAHYCEPDSIDSIRATIIRAFETKPDPELRRRVLQNFTWRCAAEKTLHAYKIALGDAAAEVAPKPEMESLLC